MKSALAAVLALLTSSLLATTGNVRAEPRTGAIAGSVTLTVARGVPLPTAAYGRRGVAPKADVAGRETRRVVVYLSGEKSPAPPSPVKAQIAQRGEQFVPSVVAVPVGSTVDFPNEDQFFHNVFSLSSAGTFDLGRYPSGESRSRLFARPGVVKVFCHLHSQMSALIVVLEHRWFTIPTESGTFMLGDVPAGEHTLVAWHDRIGESRTRLNVSPGATARVSFTLPVLEAER